MDARLSPGTRRQISRSHRVFLAATSQMWPPGVDEAGGSHPPRPIHRTIQQFHSACS